MIFGRMLIYFRCTDMKNTMETVEINIGNVPWTTLLGLFET